MKVFVFQLIIEFLIIATDFASVPKNQKINDVNIY